jgi:hypothetical protein
MLHGVIKNRFAAAGLGAAVALAAATLCSGSASAQEPLGGGVVVGPGYAYGGYYAAPGAFVTAPGPYYEYDATPYYDRRPDSSRSYQYGRMDPANCGPGKPIC